MCGISLFIDNHGRYDKQLITGRMCNAVLHRGPDHYGSYFSAQVAIGHRRLSIIDLSDKANQPMEKWGHVIAFNGEVYNYHEIRIELQQFGYQFQTNSDTEIFLAAYDRWKTSCFDRLNGMWAAVIYDQQNRKIILSRDRFGIKPLVYCSNPDFFAAASETKQLLQIPGISFKANREAVKKFILFGSLNTDSSTFRENIFEVPAGNYLEYSIPEHAYKIEKWYSLKTNRPVPRQYNEIVYEFKDLFLDSLSHITRADVPVAALLSGGLDSSAILSGVQKIIPAGNRIAHTFSSCFNEEEYNEMPYIDAMLKQVPVPNNKVYPMEYRHTFHSAVCRMVYFHDQPLRTASHLSEYFVFKEVQKSNYKVVIGGQGADEYLGGYKDFHYLYALNLFRNHSWLELLSFIVNKSNIDEISFFRQALTYYYFIKSRYKTGARISMPSWMNKVFETYYYDQYPYQADSFEELSEKQFTKTSIPFQLHSEDRNAMMFSIESRQPFLDYRLVEFCLSIPFRHKMKNGWTKSVLRDAFTELPDAVRHRRKKLGFPFPAHLFLQSSLEPVRDYLRKYQDYYSEYLSPPLLALINHSQPEKLFEADPDLVFRLYSLCAWYHHGNAEPTVN